MLANPLIERYRYTLLRPTQFWIYVAIYASIVGLLFFINFAGYQTAELFSKMEELFRSLYIQFLVLQVFVLIIWSAVNSGSAIKAEIANNSYDFFRMLPLSATKKALGVLLGKNLVALLLGAINFLLMLVFGLLGRVNSFLQLQVFVTIVCLALFTNSLALLTSINPTKKRTKNTSIFGFIFIVLFVLPIAANAVFALTEIDDLQSYTVDFYSLAIPVLILASLIALHFSAWAFTGILRKFTKEEQPLFSRPGAFFFLLAYDFIMLGLISPHFADDVEAVYGFWVAAFIPILLIPLASMRNFESYLEHTARSKLQSGSSKHPALSTFAFSNLSLGLGLFVIWAVLAISTMFSAPGGFMPTDLGAIPVFLSFYVFGILLLELYVLFCPRYTMIGYLLAFIAFLHLVLPLIFAGIFDSDTAPVFSLFGCFFYVIDEGALSPALAIGITAVNVALSIIPATLVVARYRHLLTLRRTM